MVETENLIEMNISEFFKDLYFRAKNKVLKVLVILGGLQNFGQNKKFGRKLKLVKLNIWRHFSRLIFLCQKQCFNSFGYFWALKKFFDRKKIGIQN